MPTPNEQNPPCPACGHTPTKQHGCTAAGTQRYACPACGKTWTGTPRGGHNRIADGLSAQQRYERANRARISAQQRERRRRKKILAPLDTDSECCYIKDIEQGRQFSRCCEREDER